MTDTSIKNELIDQIDKLSPELQRSLLDFAKTLVNNGTEGKSLLRFEGAIPAGDLELMRKVIEDGCEKVDTGDRKT